MSGYQEYIGQRVLCRIKLDYPVGYEFDCEPELPFLYVGTIREVSSTEKAIFIDLEMYDDDLGEDTSRWFATEDLTIIDIL